MSRAALSSMRLPTMATLPPTERAVAALSFDAVKAEVEKLATQYADITAISNKAGRDQAHSAAMALKSKRVEIQRRAKEVREDAVAFQKAVIAKGAEVGGSPSDSDADNWGVAVVAEGVRIGSGAKLAAKEMADEDLPDVK